MRNTIEILGVNVDNISAKSALEQAVEMAVSSGTSVIYTPNPEIIMTAHNDPEFAEILNNADLCVPDGIGVVYGARILGADMQERVAGFDLSCGILEALGKTGGSVFLFGSKPGVAELAKENLEKKYQGLKVCGMRNGYFSDADEEEIVAQINDSGANLLMVCLGAPKQEKWIAKYKDRLTNVNLCIGAGGSLDVLAGTVKRAPEIFIKLNLEWFYRLCKQPSRIGRFVALPKFILCVREDARKNRKRGK